MQIDETELSESALNFINRLKEKYDFDDAEAITHLVDLIEDYEIKVKC